MDLGRSDPAGLSFSLFLQSVSGSDRLHPLIETVAGWIESEPLRGLLTWRIPTQVEWEEMPKGSLDPVECESQWLADRFLLTYVADWHTASLHSEYRWQRGNQTAQIGEGDMERRGVPPEQLDAEIARRAVEGDPRERRAVILARVVELLEQREFELAAALFQGALALAPSQWARNGLAFCLIPSDPSTACELFAELLSEEYEMPLVHANLVAASHLLGRSGEVRRHAEAGLQLLGDEVQPWVVILWGLGPDEEPVLVRMQLREYLETVQASGAPPSG